MNFGKIKVTDFGKRHFDPKFGGTKITDRTPEEFERELNDLMDVYQDDFEEASDLKLMDGYAPFCKLISIPNSTNAKVGSLPIKIENYQYLRTGYSARTEKELPVLSRWFELPVPVPTADYLVIVVYTRTQLEQEFYSRSTNDTFDEKFDMAPDDEWGVVAILGQTHPGEEPMQPITMLRNALGKEEGGSGVPLDREKYKKSVEFWTENAIVKS